MSVFRDNELHAALASHGISLVRWEATSPRPGYVALPIVVDLRVHDNGQDWAGSLAGIQSLVQILGHTLAEHRQNQHQEFQVTAHITIAHPNQYVHPSPKNLSGETFTPETEIKGLRFFIRENGDVSIDDRDWKTLGVGKNTMTATRREPPPRSFAENFQAFVEGDD